MYTIIWLSNVRILGSKYVDKSNHLEPKQKPKSETRTSLIVHSAV